MKLLNDLELLPSNKPLDIKEFRHFTLGSERRIRTEVHPE